MESSNCLNINSSSFNADLYYKKLLKVIFSTSIHLHRSNFYGLPTRACSFFEEVQIGFFLLQECSLKQLMDKENEIIKDAQTLHSDMQTLVYENYNKFISATETIKKVHALNLVIRLYLLPY